MTDRKLITLGRIGKAGIDSDRNLSAASRDPSRHPAGLFYDSGSLTAVNFQAGKYQLFESHP